MGRADTPDGFMGRKTIAGIWHIGEARWVTTFTHPAIINYSWTAYPELRSVVSSEVVYVAKGEDGLPCESVDAATARYHSGDASNRPRPLGYESESGHNHVD